jgi:DNA-binding NtrC family response regulator
MSRKNLETILVVDDDDEVLRYTAATLMRGGYSAIAVQSGDDAYRVYLKRGSEIQLILTDVVMPHTSGPALVQSLKQQNPDLNVLFMTGYKAEHFRQFGETLKNYKILSKPFTPNELLSTVRKVLDGRAGGHAHAHHVSA